MAVLQYEDADPDEYNVSINYIDGKLILYLDNKISYKGEGHYTISLDASEIDDLFYVYLGRDR